MTVSANDVAAYMLSKTAPMTTMKLQKLLYYVQGWSLAWDEVPLFNEKIEAWANGPVVPDVFKRHRGEFQVNDWKWGNPKKLNKDQSETVDVILDTYGKLTGQQMSDKTHVEPPWKNARQGVKPGDPSHNAISLDDMQDYFGGLDELSSAYSDQE